MDVKFYFIKYKLLFHLRGGDPIYCLPKKKHIFQALRNSAWIHVHYLSFFSPFHSYSSLDFQFLVRGFFLPHKSGARL